MKITDIHIDRFGVWNDLHLELRSSGLSTFYGPNEAGKTTLLKFIRGVLFGFAPAPEHSRSEPAQSTGQLGALTIEHGGRLCEIRRASDGRGRGLVTVAGDGAAAGDDLLADTLQGADEALYEKVFAVGLAELQELATLEGDAVAKHIYGLSLGPRGRRLLAIGEDLDRRRKRIVGDDGRSGRLARLLARDAELAAKLNEFESQGEDHRRLVDETAQWEELIAELRSRQTGYHSQLRGHVYLERVHPPWRQVRQYEDELERIPVVETFPERGLERLNKLDEELDSLSRCRDTLRAEAQNFRRQIEALRGDMKLATERSAVEGLVAQRQWFGETRARSVANEQRLTEVSATLAGQLECLGGEWTAERLDKIDAGPAVQARMVDVARRYRAALSRRKRLRRRCERIGGVCRKSAAAIRAKLEATGGGTIEEARAVLGRRLSELDEFRTLNARADALKQEASDARRELFKSDEHTGLPRWVSGVLAAFVVVGAAFAVTGLVAGATSSVLAGLAYLFIGATCGISAWALKGHFADQGRLRHESLEDRLRTAETELRHTHHAIERLAQGDAELVSGDIAEKLQACAEQLAEFDRLERRYRRMQARRRRWHNLRKQLPDVQRQLVEQRGQWCGLLAQLGLPETPRVDEAFATWCRVAEAVETRREQSALSDKVREDRRRLADFARRIDETARRLERPLKEPEDRTAVLDGWAAELERLEAARAQVRSLRRDEKERRREARQYDRQIDRLETERSALLVRGGASGREEFEQRSQWHSRRRDCLELLELVRDELETAARTEPDLAIVEEDLLAFDAEANAESMAAINLELEDLERELHEAHETLGSLKQRLRELESDRRASRLRFERAQVQSKLCRLAEQWCAACAAGDAVDRLRSAYERTCQPATLATASRYLDGLTGGRYRNVWCPLGERALRVDGPGGRALTVAELSNGTREQLFLAVRLAVVERLAEQGVELPMVLDDVLVNFDQRRTEAAVETLLAFAEQGRQVLFFTCHLHLAHLFESRGHAAVWLPSHGEALEGRRAG
ncbi:MAG: AAA family ATPase [Planctomycetes bacterium]|nr:AAA family ATPase [Planctomycetota bacterium]